MIWAAVAMILAPTIWAIQDRAPPIAFVSAQADVTEVLPGGRVITSFVIEQRRPQDECRLVVDRDWVDARGIRWFLSDVGLTYPRGFNQIGLTLAAPMDASAGPLSLVGVVKAACNWTQKLAPIEIEMPTLQVTVKR